MRAKRTFDVVVAFFALVVLSPILIAISACVLLFLGRPVFFRQERPGFEGQPFFIIKFRTMSDARSADGSELSDELRLTRFGRFLRATSLDELPALWNVLTGDMSLVGPRPLLMEYLPLYNQDQRRRHEVRPGITGWAQVNGRNEISWERKFELDVWYIENWSFALDLRILWLTLHRVTKADGISSAGCATAERFRGSKP